MKAHKTEHILVGAAPFKSGVFDHRELRRVYLMDDCIIFIDDETVSNTIAPWHNTFDYESIDNYPEERL